MILTFWFLFSRALALDVVCTLPYLADTAKRVAPSANVVSLARGTDDPHFLSPTPALMAQVAKADLFVENGLGLELWSERLLDSAGNPQVRPGQNGYVKATTGVPVLEVPADVSRARGDLHAEGNPHVWTDPLNMKIVADNIATGLGRVDPSNAAVYTQNAAAYKKKIDEALFGADLVGYMGGDLLSRLAAAGTLDTTLAKKRLTARLGGWLAKGAPLKGKPVVFYHQSWPYFIARFGVKVVGYVEDRPGIPPTAAHRDQLLGLMSAQGASVIAVTNYNNDRVPRLLGEATGAKVVTVPGDVGGVSGATDYFSFIDGIIAALL